MRALAAFRSMGLLVGAALIAAVGTLDAGAQKQSYTDRYRDTYNDDNFQKNYRDNYQNNSRIFDRDNRSRRIEGLRPLQGESGPYRDPSLLQRGRKRIIGLKDNRTFNAENPSSAPLFLLQPPALMQGYAAGIVKLGTPAEDDLSADAEVLGDGSAEAPLEPEPSPDVLSPKELLVEQAVEAFQDKLYFRARDRFESLMEIDPSRDVALAGHGLSLMATRDYEGAAAILVSERRFLSDVWARFFPKPDDARLLVWRLEQHVLRDPLASVHAKALLDDMRDLMFEQERGL